jgi:TDG/mug DNA glycosylase family protein
VKEILSDSIEPRMAVVFCGTAVGARSAVRGAYYAGIGNAFWRTLHEIGLTPRRFEPEQYRSAAALGIGFTDLAKTVSGNDVILRQEHFGRDALRQKVLKFEPEVVAFTSKRAAEEFLERPVEYGLLEETVGSSLLFVLPSPSGAARRWWQVQRWHELAELVRNRHRTGQPSGAKSMCSVRKINRSV